MEKSYKLERLHNLHWLYCKKVFGQFFWGIFIASFFGVITTAIVDMKGWGWGVMPGLFLAGLGVIRMSAALTGVVMLLKIGNPRLRDKLKFWKPYIAACDVYKAPGSKLLAFVEFFYSPKTVEHTFKPLVADWHHELFEALKTKRTWKALWISVRYRYAFIKAMGLSKVWSAIETVFGLVKKG